MCLPSPEDGSRSSYRNVDILDFRTMDKVQKPILNANVGIALRCMWSVSSCNLVVFRIPKLRVKANWIAVEAVQLWTVWRAPFDGSMHCAHSVLRTERGAMNWWSCVAEGDGYSLVCTETYLCCVPRHIYVVTHVASLFIWQQPASIYCLLVYLINSY